MIKVNVPEDALYDEFVLKTITNISIHQLRLENDTINDLVEAYDLIKRKNANNVTDRDIIKFDNKMIDVLENRYNKTLKELGELYETFYNQLVEIEVTRMNNTWKTNKPIMLDALNEILLSYGINH
jgi:chromatin remodeling complex protein RSC6